MIGRHEIKRTAFITVIIAALCMMTVYAGDDEYYLLDGKITQKTSEGEVNVSEKTEISGIQDNNDGTYTVKNLNIPADAASFNGHYYYYFDIPDVSWSLANTICFVYGGNLVSISSAQEQIFIENRFPGTQGWIGASLEEGEWEWTTDEPFEFTNWKQGEPNNQNGSEGYAHLYTGMQWNDLPEDDTTYHRGFYCEWESDTQTYYYNGRFGDDITSETRKLVEEGKDYYYGTGDEGYDISRARSCFADACDGYDGEAWYYLGKIFANGLIDGKNLDYRSMGSFERAVEYGSALGWFGLGTCYREGVGVTKNYDIAIQLYQRAIDLGCVEADYGMGIMYDLGFGVDRDIEKAMEYYEKASHCEDFGWRNEATCTIGDIYCFGYNGSDPDYETAFWWYSQGGQEGYSRSCAALANMYEKGYGVERDDNAAFYWYDWAAWYGDVRSVSKLADCYYYGTGIDENKEMAFEKYLKAAEMGYPYAMYSAGFMYEYGKGTAQNLEQARFWYTKALENSETEEVVREAVNEELALIDAGKVAVTGGSNNTDPQNTGYNTSANYSNNYQYETQPWEDPYFTGYTQDGIPQYSDRYIVDYMQDGTPVYSYYSGGYDTSADYGYDYDYYYDYQYETQPWEDPYFIGYTQDGTPQYSY